MAVVPRKLPTIPVWHRRWGPPQLAAERKRNARAFARGFQMRPYSDEERWFPSFASCYQPGLVLGEVQRRGYPVFVGVDLSSDKRPGNVLFVAAYDAGSGLKYPLEVLRGAWTSPQVAARLAELERRYYVRTYMVENNGYQQALIDWINTAQDLVVDGTPIDKRFRYKIDAYTTSGASYSVERGLPSLEVELHNKQWMIPRSEYEAHELSCDCGWCTWDREMTDFPHSPQTDTVMAAFFCREAIERYGWAGGAGGAGGGIGSDFNAR